MRRKIFSALGIVVFLILISRTATFSQETPTEPETTQWVWGEVVAVEALKNELRVKYLDYETEEEKEIFITVNEQTVYENVNTLSEMVAQDTVSIDYVVSPEGKNIAKNISVERPEVQSESQEEAVPEESLPVSPSVE